MVVLGAIATMMAIENRINNLGAAAKRRKNEIEELKLARYRMQENSRRELVD